MNAHARTEAPAPHTPGTGAPAARVIAEGASVVLLQPRRLRGTIGVVQRRMTRGWEVEIRSALGTPMHLTLPEKALYLR